jgi:Zn finger protein HypA/HybF involved in hydrogenase expression
MKKQINFVAPRDYVCPICEGTGKQHCDVFTLEFDERIGELVEIPNDAFDMECVLCKGTGFVDEKGKQVYEFEKDMWCRCEDSHGVTFYDDDEHPELSKHHYRCNKCKKIVQIG